MRKILAVCLALGLGIALMPKAISAATIDRGVAVSASVNDLFVFTADQTTLSFGALGTGVESPPLSVNLVTRSNHDSIWTIALSATPLIHTDGTTVMSQFKYFVVDDGVAGTLNPPTGSAAVPGSPTVVYTAATAERNTEYSANTLGFIVVTAANQKSGAYSSSVTITLNDNLI